MKIPETTTSVQILHILSLSHKLLKMKKKKKERSNGCWGKSENIVSLLPKLWSALFLPHADTRRKLKFTFFQQNTSLKISPEKDTSERYHCIK
ncbi:hypothetical protein CEXT_237831 [Caerostris extrusa]|uniref:Uncharacterized protein n=1 Tax=Caerostris extrusa TaxID=172846 RepID=A0AAV4RG90_CAEEX|nr:hypothetical protein CEXT_237831 [Caerostris extrusa]